MANINLKKSDISDYKHLLEIRKKSKRSRIKRRIYLSVMVFMICAGLTINYVGFMVLAPSVVNFIAITALQCIAFISSFSYYELYLMEKGGRQS